MPTLSVLAKATALLLLGLGLMPLLHRRPAALRHAVLLGSLCAALLLPVLSRALPPVRAPLLAPRPVAPLLVPAPRGAAVQVALPESPFRPSLDASKAAARRSIPFDLIWAAGAGLFLAAFGLGLQRMRRLLRHSVPLDDPHWRSQLNGTMRELGVQAPVDLLLNAAIDIPIVSRVRKPAIVLPVVALEWPMERRRVVLLHELMHLRRGDGVVEYVARFASAVYWFHPAVWLTARRLRLERELACDEAVVRHFVAAADYADHLVEIAATASRQRFQPALAMASGGALERRVRAILALPAERPPASRWFRALLAGGIGALVLGLSAMQPVHRVAAAGAADTLELPLTSGRNLAWIGKLAPGDTFTVRAAMGNIAIDSSADTTVLVTVRRRAGPRGVNADTRFGVIKSAGRLAVCSIHFDRGRRVAPCTTSEDWGRGSVDDNAVSFEITLPPGVHLIAMTGNGEVKALHMHGDVTAMTGAGSAYVETDGAANLEALSGDMHLILRDGGRGGPVTLNGMHSQIRLALSDAVGANLEATTGQGMISVLDRTVGDGASPARFFGPIGRSDRMIRRITASLRKGDIRISQP